MRKALVKTLDVLLGVAVLAALALGWMQWQALGLLLAFVASALICGIWAAISLLVEHLEQLRRLAEVQTKMIDAIDYNLTAVASRIVHRQDRDKITP